MPTILIREGYRFHFRSFDCQESRHVHANKDGKEAKVWLDPVSVASEGRFSTKQINDILRIVQAEAGYFRSKWDEHCAGT